MVDQKRPFNGVRFVEIDFGAFLRRHMAGILVVRILRHYSYFTGRKAVDYLIDNGGLSRAGSTGDSYD